MRECCQSAACSLRQLKRPTLGYFFMRPHLSMAPSIKESEAAREMNAFSRSAYEGTMMSERAPLCHQVQWN